jgi:hypothetical protein
MRRMIGFHYLIFFENFAKHDVEMTIVALPASGRLLQKNMPQNQKKYSALHSSNKARNHECSTTKKFQKDFTFNVKMS